MKKRKMNKKAFEFSFAWLFAMIVGAAILFIAVYAAITLVQTSRYQSDTITAAQLGILLNPIETSLESGKYAVIEFPDEARVFNNCIDVGNFGQQGISTAVKSGIGKEFQRPGVESVFFSKYIFSSDVEEGKRLHIFVKPFEMPYKIADLIFASAKEYCFVSPPRDIEDEIDDLNIENIKVVFGIEECLSENRKVCFSNVGCDVDVNPQAQTVTVNDQGSSETVYYEGSLVYGAIFASPKIYECQVKRLMKRSSELAHLYNAKTEFLEAQGCASNLAIDLVFFSSVSQINNDENSFKLQEISSFSEDLGRRNGLLSCKLF